MTISENFDKVLKTHKTIDILLNNAGIGADSNTELMIDVNYVSEKYRLKGAATEYYIYNFLRTSESRSFGKLTVHRTSG